MRRLASLLLATLLMAPCPARAADDEGEDVTDPLPWRIEPDTVFQRRIVEAATGKPVAGALVRLYAEESIPAPGFGSPMASAKSDVNGWVRIRRSDLDVELVESLGDPDWAYAEAPGLGPNGESDATASDADFSLDRSTTTRVTVRDPMGRPVADANIGWFIGCGHMPDQRSARTGPDGIARLFGVSNDDQAQLWFDRAGFSSAYAEDGATAWQRSIATDVDWGHVFEGTILTSEGTPAAGVAVGAPFSHRGPWTKTDACGGFRLIGSQREPGDNLDVIFDPQADDTPTGTRTSIEFPAPPPGHRAIVRLPAPGVRIEEPAATRLVVEPKINWPSSKVEPLIRITAVRTTDGWTETGYAGSQRVALLDVRPGAYVVYAEVRREGCGLICSRGRATVTVPEGVGAWIPVKLPAPAFLPIVFASPPGEGFDLKLLTEGEAARVGLEEAETGVEVWIATDRPVYVRTSRDNRSHVVAVDPKRLVPYESAPEVVVPTFPPLEIRARFVDEQGRPVEGWLHDLSIVSQGNDGEELRGTAPSPTPSVTVAADDRMSLVAWPKDEVRFQPSIIEAASSPFGGKPIDLGEVRLTARAPVLRIEDPSGKPHKDAQFLLTRGERTEKVWTQGGLVVDPWLAPGLLGDATILRSIGDSEEVSFVRRLEGAGPWTIRAPKGTLTVEVRGVDDAPMNEWNAHLDGRSYAHRGASLRLTTLDAGPHEVVVEASGFTPRRLRFTLAADEQRTWIARLRASPSGPR